MATNNGEVVEVSRSIPFQIDGDLVDTEGGASQYIMLRWSQASGNIVPPYWSRARDKWLRLFVTTNGPIKTTVNTFINKVVTVPWNIQAKDRSISRHVRNAELLEKSLRRLSGSMSSGPMRGFKSFMKMFVKDYLTQDAGAYAVVLGDGRSDGPIVGAPSGLLHLDAALCIPTRDDEFPVKYLNAGRGGDHKEYKLHYTRVIHMVNLPSAEIDLNGIGLCAVSCCIEAAQELYDIYMYNQEMFGSRPPRQILYAKKGATVKTMQDAVEAWNLKLQALNQTHFGGTLMMAPRGMGQELELDVLGLSQMPENFNRRDVTTINKSEIAAAFGMDLRDLAYVMGAPSRTGDAEVQDKKGRGKGVGELLETFLERMQQSYLNDDLFEMSFDNLDDDQDEQEAVIHDKRSAGRERDLRSAVTTIRVERERMWENHEITYEQFAQMELEDGRLPEGLDVLLLFQSEDKDYKNWLDVGVSDPTNIGENDPQKMADAIHDKYIEVSGIIHEETRAERRRKARQALAALDKLRSMYQVPEGQAITDQATLAAMDEGAATGVDPTAGATAAPSPTATQKPKNEAKPQAVSSKPKELVSLPAASAVDGHILKQLDVVDGELDQYERQLAYLVEQAVTAQISRERFQGALEQIVTSILLTLFARGARVSFPELTEAMRAEINILVQDHLRSLDDFADGIYGGLYAEDRLGLDGALLRVGMWVTIASGIYFLGETHRPDDPYLAWRMNPLKDHCNSCVHLDGQIHTASEWRASGYYPRSFSLDCRGVHCGCSFIQVEGPSAGVI